jgi:hypothetical protein
MEKNKKAAEKKAAKAKIRAEKKAVMDQQRLANGQQPKKMTKGQMEKKMKEARRLSKLLGRDDGVVADEQCQNGVCKVWYSQMVSQSLDADVAWRTCEVCEKAWCGLCCGEEEMTLHEGECSIEV